jgi:hypothetical protein
VFLLIKLNSRACKECFLRRWKWPTVHVDMVKYIWCSTHSFVFCPSVTYSMYFILLCL